MNIRHFHPYILIAAALTLMTSCSGYLKEYSQDSDYVRSWEDLNELLIGSCYEPTFSANTGVGERPRVFHPFPWR